MNKSFLGIDLGTSAVKAVRVSPAGTVEKSRATYEEISPQGWYRALGNALRQLNLTDVAEKKEGNSVVVYIIMALAAAIGIGAGYYFKVYKKKQEIEEDEELYEEEPYENENEDWDNFEVEDKAEDMEGETDE